MPSSGPNPGRQRQDDHGILSVDKTITAVLMMWKKKYNLYTFNLNFQQFQQKISIKKKIPKSSPIKNGKF